jgi:hypothetical protein
MITQGLELQRDIYDLGSLLIQLLEPSASQYDLDQDSINLGRWSSQARSFMRKTRTDQSLPPITLGQLLEDNFCQLSPGLTCLIPHVCIADRTTKARRNWEILI